MDPGQVSYLVYWATGPLSPWSILFILQGPGFPGSPLKQQAEPCFYSGTLHKCYLCTLMSRGREATDSTEKFLLLVTSKQASLLPQGQALLSFSQFSELQVGRETWEGTDSLNKQRWSCDVLRGHPHYHGESCLASEVETQATGLLEQGLC